MGKYYIRKINFENRWTFNIRLWARTPSQKTKMMSGQASQKVMVEINKLVGEEAIEYTEHEKVEFISPIFFRSKSDGTRRLILNLNEFLDYKTILKWRSTLASRFDSAILLHRLQRCLLLSENIWRRILKILCRKCLFLNLLWYQMDCLHVRESLRSTLNQQFHV